MKVKEKRPRDLVPHGLFGSEGAEFQSVPASAGVVPVVEHVWFV